MPSPSSPTAAAASRTRGRFAALDLRSVSRMPRPGLCCSVREPPQQGADPVERAVDGREVRRRDVAACACDTQCGGELARRARGAAEEVGAIEASALTRFADVE